LILKPENSPLPILDTLKKVRDIEEQLSKRYSQFAEFTDNEVASSLFTHLASECRKHKHMLDELPGLLGDAANKNYKGDSIPGRLPEIGSIIDKGTAIETTFKIVKEHVAVEESMLQYYVDLSGVVSNDEAYGIIRRLIEDERSHHETLGKLTRDLKELYGERLSLES
jgi:rubrerythrin